MRRDHTLWVSRHFWSLCAFGLLLAIGLLHAPGAWASVKLPDGRNYEMVSPPDKNGGELGLGAHASEQSSPEGQAITYDASSAYADAQDGGSGENQYLARRTATGWSTQSLSVLQASSGSTLRTSLYNTSFSEDLSKGVLEDEDLNDPDLSSPPAPLGQGAIPGYRNLYLSNFTTGTRQALTTVTPDPAVGASYNPIPETATPDYSHIVLAVNDTLTANGNPSDPTLFNVYDWFDGQLHLANILPNGTIAPTAGVGGNIGLPAFDNHDGQVHHAISDDGSKIFWTDNQNGPGNIFLREDDTSTVAVSASQKTNGTGPGGRDPNGSRGAAFWTASASGSVAYFTSCEQLTNTSTAVSSTLTESCEPSAGGVGNDLYRYDAASGSLTDVTVDHGDALGAQVLGIVGSSDDGSYVYFTANGVPDTAQGSGAHPGTCFELAGSCDLYLYHNNAIKYIATVEPTVEQLENKGSIEAIDREPFRKPAYVTPDGQHLAFTSNTRLRAANTAPGGFDNTDANTGLPDSEVYLYDANTETLTCASCNHTDTAPEGDSFIPTWNTQTYDPRSVSNDGTHIFFTSADALLPNDSDGTQDAYEFEPAGTHGCGEPAGCQYLLSSGTSPSDSLFVDSSTTASDAFFLTADQLTPQDADGAYDLYDARIGAPPPPGLTPEPCTQEACRPSGTQSTALLTPGSLTFNGPGNPPPPPVAVTKATKKTVKCKQGFVKNKKSKCVRKSKKKAKKASRNRRDK
jgi:hypothetical protein